MKVNFPVLYQNKAEGSTIKRVKREVQGVSQSQVAANPWHQEEEEKKTKSNTRKTNKHMKSTQTSSLFPKQGNRNAKRTKNARQYLI